MRDYPPLLFVLRPCTASPQIELRLPCVTSRLASDTVGSNSCTIAASPHRESCSHPAVGVCVNALGVGSYRSHWSYGNTHELIPPNAVPRALAEYEVLAQGSTMLKRHHLWRPGEMTPAPLSRFPEWESFRSSVLQFDFACRILGMRGLCHGLQGLRLCCAAPLSSVQRGSRSL